jgi:hypothetical protein
LLRIGAAEKYERDRLIKFFCNLSDVAADCQHHIRLEDYQFGCQNRKPVDPTFRITRFDRDISSLNVAQLTETLSDRWHLWIALRIAVKKDAEPRHGLRLCARCERPTGCRTSNNFDEIAPSHRLARTGHLSFSN